MNRDSENTIMLLVGVATLMITISGAFTRYVKPSLMPWLYVTAAVLIVMALVAMIGDSRGSAGPNDHGDHSHASHATWLLMVPILVLIFVAPPALRPQASVPSVSTVSTEALRRPFPPLPPGRAPEVSVTSVMLRAAQDSAGTLDGRLITVVGFTLRDGDSVDLGRFSVLCCAADARLARIHLAGPAVAKVRGFPEHTWVRVEGTLVPGPTHGDSSAIPTLQITAATETDAPANVYA